METQQAQPKKFTEEEHRRYERWSKSRRDMSVELDAMPKDKRREATLDFMLWEIERPADEELH